MNDEERQQLLADYLDGTISRSDLERLENEARNDPSLQSEMDDLKVLVKDFQKLGREPFRRSVKEWEMEYNLGNGTKSPAKSIRYYLAIAATLLFLAVSGILVFNMPFQSNEDLFTEYYEPYGDLLTTRGEIEDVLLAQGMNAYNSQKYAEAAVKLEEYTEQKPDALASLYLGICYMELDRTAAATALFTELSENPITAQQAQWFLALSNLKAGNTDKARGVLLEISSNKDHYKQKQAAELINSLD